MDNISSIKNILDISGKTAIVTGGALGIGLAIAYRLAEAGANIVIADMQADEAQKAAGDLTAKGWKVKAVTTDVSNEDNVKRLVEETISVYGGIDILVNNAGIYPPQKISDMSLKDFEKVLDVNLEGVFLCTKYVSEQMKKRGRGGKIINIASIDALHPSGVGLSAYDASKHAVWGFTKNAALELAPFKIWVNSIAPGGILTPGVMEAQKNTPAQPGVDMARMTEEFLAKIPMKRMGEPDEIGKVALFLASEMSSYMTGAQVVVDGGVLLS